MRYLIGLLLALMIGAAQSQQPPQTPQIKAEQKAERSTKAESKGAHGSEEGSEFWPPLLGYRLKVTDTLLVVFTFLLFLATVFLYRATRDLVKGAENSDKIVQRAYVKMSHRAPGLNIDKSGQAVWFTMQVKNFGQTPAEITDVVVVHTILPNNAPLPDFPDYTSAPEREVPKAFLVAGEDFSYSGSFVMSHKDVADIKEGAVRFFLYGYVDYLDKFGNRHRDGYARAYFQPNDMSQRYRSEEDFNNRSNLLFVMQQRYNYDRERKDGEGNDWGKEMSS